MSRHAYVVTSCHYSRPVLLIATAAIHVIYEAGRQTVTTVPLPMRELEYRRKRKLTTGQDDSSINKLARRQAPDLRST